MRHQITTTQEPLIMSHAKSNGQGRRVIAFSKEPGAVLCPYVAPSASTSTSAQPEEADPKTETEEAQPAQRKESTEASQPEETPAPSSPRLPMRWKDQSAIKIADVKSHDGLMAYLNMRYGEGQYGIAVGLFLLFNKRQGIEVGNADFGFGERFCSRDTT